jgi:Flp pilus assembly protein TadD
VAPAPAGTPEPALAAKEPAPREHAKHHHATASAAKAAGTPAAVATAPAVAAPAPPAPVAPAPPPRGAGEVLAEADKLLGQGEVAEACTRGEEAKRMSPRLPSVYKFLGKCYMRAGRAQQANDNYKKYLELAPNATDAPFVKSMIK